MYVDNIANALKKRGNEFEIVNNCFELCRLEEDDTSLIKGSELIKKYVIKNIRKGEQWYELYRKILLLRAPYVFDDYLIYLEIDRPPEERFYQPRRKILKQVVDELQKLADDELDELFVSMPPRVGKTTIIMMFITWIIGKNSELTNLYSAFSDTITSAMYSGILEIINDEYTYNWKKIFNNSSVVDTDAKKETIDINRKKRYKSLTCRSLYGTLNGACDCKGYLISDDLIGGIEEALNKDRMMSAWSKVSNNLIPRAKQTAKKVWVGTRWSLIDPAGLRMDFLENDKEGKKVRYKIINLPALDENDESNFDYDYNPNMNNIPNNNDTVPISGDMDYAENILELNVGKEASFYMSYSDSLEWRDRVFTGTIIGAGRDYAVVKDSENRIFLLWTVYLNYVEFREDITLR